MSAYSDNFKNIDWSGFKPTKRQVQTEERGKAPYVMPDITPFRSPLSGKVLSSRKQVQHEERGYGARQCGEMKTAEEFNNFKAKPQVTNERALERAYGQALEKLGMR